MSQKNVSRFLMLVVIMLSVSMLSACSSFSKKFSTTMAEDVDVFADQTISIMSEADLGFGKGDSIYVRPFIDLEAPEEKAFLAAEEKSAKLLRGMVLYSLDLSRIAETYDSDDDKINAYADLMAGIRDETQQNMNFTKESYAELIAEIRDQSTFRAALLKAQAIVNLFGQYLNQEMNEFSGQTTILVAAVDQRIDDRYKDVIEYQRALEKEKYAVLRGMGQLYKYYSGEDQAYSRLIDSGVIRETELIPKGEPDKKQVRALGQHLNDRLKLMHLIGQEIQPDWDTYRATHRELDEKQAEIKRRITAVRAISVIWTRAHLKMASGKSEPAEWFDVEDVPSVVKLLL